jgi:hypothetical protein
VAPPPSVGHNENPNPRTHPHGAEANAHLLTRLCRSVRALPGRRLRPESVEPCTSRKIVDAPLRERNRTRCTEGRPARRRRSRGSAIRRARKFLGPADERCRDRRPGRRLKNVSHTETGIDTTSSFATPGDPCGADQRGCLYTPKVLGRACGPAVRRDEQRHESTTSMACPSTMMSSTRARPPE